MIKTIQLFFKKGNQPPPNLQQWTYRDIPLSLGRILSCHYVIETVTC